MILNDVPTTDPRWNKTNTSGDAVQDMCTLIDTLIIEVSFRKGINIQLFFFVADSLGSYSLIILNQLQDKQKAHKKLIQFLIDMELLDLVSSSNTHTHFAAAFEIGEWILEAYVYYKTFSIHFFLFTRI